MYVCDKDICLKIEHSCFANSLSSNRLSSYFHISVCLVNGGLIKSMEVRKKMNTFSLLII